MHDPVNVCVQLLCIFQILRLGLHIFKVVSHFLHEGVAVLETLHGFHEFGLQLLVFLCFPGIILLFLFERQAQLLVVSKPLQLRRDKQMWI